MDNDEIYVKLKEILISEFEIAGGLIDPDKLLYDDLKFDSLDAVDLIVLLKNHLGSKIEPALFKNAKTIRDVVEILRPLWLK